VTVAHCAAHHVRAHPTEADHTELHASLFAACRPYPCAVRPPEIRLAALIATLAFFDLAMWLTAIPLIPVWERDLGISHTQSGIVLGSYGVAVLFLSLPVGHVADRVGARRLTIGATLLFAATAPLYAFASSFEELLALRLVNGLFSAVSWTAGLAWLVASVPGTHRGRTLAIVNATASAASLVGPLIGGPVVTAIGLKPTMLAFGGVILLLGVWALFEPNRGAHTATEHASAVTALRIGVREPGLLHAFAGIAFAASAMGVQQVLAPIHLSDLGLSSAGIGWIWTAGAVVSLGVAAFVGRRLDQIDKRANARMGVLTVTLLSGFLALGLGVAPYTVGVIATLGLGTLIWTTVYPLCSEAADRAGIGQGVAMGALNSVWALASVVAPIAAGVLAEQDLAAAGYLAVVAFGGMCLWVLRQRALAPSAGTT
jgi:MFS family permease